MLFVHRSRLTMQASGEDERDSPDSGGQNICAGALTPTFDFFCSQRSCEFRSAKRSAVMLHIRAKHGLCSASALRRCPHCDHVTAHVSNLRTHILARHSLQRPWLCDKCGRKFADKSYYNAHMKRHRKEFRYKCSSCDSCFLLPSHLRAHVESRHHELNLGKDARNPQLLRSCDAGDGCGAEGFSELVRSNRNMVPVRDHDYYQVAAPAKQQALVDILECIECSSFFASFESLRAHTHARHRSVAPCESRVLRMKESVPQ
ncbi:zinc finger protein 710 [Galendromus occidentalis]|uniref:Zinc finger protein 710 n=1 Tax=Galendromus occidentalis TaxID=34638 RepID=A0AAJ7L6F2_9ACAR|nr:zinc finger protein 710 [Galendromus occidentalis]